MLVEKSIIRYSATVLIGILLGISPLTAQEKVATPSETAQQQALELIKEVYGEQWENAKTVHEKQALAASLLQKAVQSPDAANRYVLLEVARGIAVQAGDIHLAFQVVDKMDCHYDVDTYKLRGVALSQAAKSASLPEHHSAIAKHALSLIDWAVEKDDFVAGKFLGRLAQDAARRAKDYPLVKRVVACNRENDRTAAAYAQLADALATLEKTPVDPKANLDIGRYHCFIKANWEKGLAMLALGSDENLKELAIRELEGASVAAEQVALGDTWWELAEETEGKPEEHMRARAASWYRTALPGLKGLVKTKVEKRLTEAPSSSGRIRNPPRPKHEITFKSAADMRHFVVARGSQLAVANGLLRMAKARITYATHFKSISSVTIEGGISPTTKTNFRAAVGPVNMILNWEVRRENHFRYTTRSNKRSVTTPSALQPGRIHQIQVLHKDGTVFVLIDGKQHYSAAGELAGTVTIYTSHGSELGIRKIVIEGEPDHARKVTGPIPDNGF